MTSVALLAHELRRELGRRGEAALKVADDDVLDQLADHQDLDLDLHVGDARDLLVAEAFAVDHPADLGLLAEGARYDPVRVAARRSIEGPLLDVRERVADRLLHGAR